MANELLGYNAKIKINSTVFDVVSGEPRNTRSTAPADTTATGRYKNPVIDKEGFECSITAIRKSNLNPHAAPLNIAPTFSGSNDTVNFKYWPNGDADIADDTKAWRCAAFLVTEYSESFDAKQGLITLTFKGESQGVFYRPGDA